MDAIILAAGESKRFGKNKLLEKFDEHILIEYTLKFIQENEINGNVIIVINNKDTYVENNIISHPIIDIINNSKFFNKNIKYVFQDKDEYGPAAGIKAAAPLITEDYIVLFGDNYYNGKIEKKFSSAAIATYKIFYESEDNLRFAYADLRTCILVEKPHKYVHGSFFVGYIMFKKYTLDKLKELQKSDRGEYEITELFNIQKSKTFKELEIDWIDITYLSDVASVKDYIKNTNQ
jgi:dTDP-glucose pyrophosphorylase